MMSANLEFWFFVMLVAIFTITVLSAVIFPLMHRVLGTLRPVMRANVMLGWCVAPLVLGVIIAFAPWFLSALGLAPADCGRLSDAFLRSCGPDCSIGRVFPAIFNVVLLAPFVWFIFSSVRRIRAALALNRQIDSLLAVGQPHIDADVTVIDSDEPVAFATGWRRGRIVIASCLQDSLSDAQMRAVLAHERAHVNRHDTLRYMIAEVVSVVHLPWVRTALLEDLRLATEQACDESAAEIGGDRLGVAETLLCIERMFGQRSCHSAVPVHLLGGDLEARVDALLAGRQTTAGRWRRTLLVIAFFFSVTVMIGAVPLHELLGYLLGYVQG